MTDTTQTSLLIPSRFNGPPSSGNGGYSAGALATLVEGPTRVSLRSPPPLEVPLEVRREGLRVEAWHNDTLIMSAQPAAPTHPLPSPPTLEQASRRRSTIDPGHHPLPSCFVCGPHRASGDGLRLFAGPTEGFDGVTEVWNPAANLAANDGRVRSEVLWAALDCPSFCAIPGRLSLALLGSMCARIHARPPAGHPLIVVGWHQRSEGRKHATGSALFTADGTLVAQADTLWIQVKAELAAQLVHG